MSLTQKILSSIGWVVLFAAFTFGAAGSLDFEYKPGMSVVGLLFFVPLAICWLWLAWKTVKSWVGANVATATVVFFVLLYIHVIWVAWIGTRS